MLSGQISTVRLEGGGVYVVIAREFVSEERVRIEKTYRVCVNSRGLNMNTYRTRKGVK